MLNDARWRQEDTTPPIDLLAREREFFGPTNTEVAAALLRAWRMPLEVYIPIRDHYLQGLAVEPMPMAKQLYLAAGAADAAGWGIAGEAGYWAAQRDDMLKELQLDGDTFSRIVERASKRFEKTLSVLA